MQLGIHDLALSRRKLKETTVERMVTKRTIFDKFTFYMFFSYQLSLISLK